MKLLFPLLLAATLSGCAAINPGEPAFKEIQGPATGLQASTLAWPAQQWWARYKDPQLDQLIVEALQSNPTLAAAQARLSIARASVQGARAVQLPQLNANYNQVRERFSNNYIYPPPLGGAMDTDAKLQLNLGFDLDLWGKNRSRYAASVSRAEAAQAETQAARNALVSAVTQSYFNLQNALAEHDVITKIVRQLENVASITRGRVRAGLDTEVEINQADSAVSAAKVQLNQVDTNGVMLRHQLAALMGAGPARGQSVERALPRRPPTATPENIPMDLLGRRPDIVAAKRQIQASASEISAAKAQFFPDVNLSAFAGFMSLGLSNLLRNGSQTYGVGPAISLPLFNGGALNAQLSGKRGERDLAIANYNQTVLTAVREVADAITAIKALQQQAVDQSASYRSISSAYDIAVKRYKSGLGNFLQVLLAQNEVQKQAILDTDLRIRAYNLDAQLATALGGGYAVAAH